MIINKIKTLANKTFSFMKRKIIKKLIFKILKYRFHSLKKLKNYHFFLERVAKGLSEARNDMRTGIPDISNVSRNPLTR